MSSGKGTRITRQAEAQCARSRVALCYLCGKKLDLRATADDRKVTADHVVPKSLLGLPEGDSGWRVILDVHQSCHDEKNREGDHWLSTWHKMNTAGASEWNPRDVRGLPMEPKHLVNPHTGEVERVMTGMDALMSGVWKWIRGMHMFLYGIYLPSPMGREIWPPNPGFMAEERSPVTGKRLPGLPVKQAELEKRAILHLLRAALEADRFDGIRAWNGRMQYLCFWQKVHKPGFHRCMWGLSFDGLEKYSSALRWKSTPWCGRYHVVRAPPDRSVLNDEQMHAYRKRTFDDEASTQRG